MTKDEAGRSVLVLALLMVAGGTSAQPTTELVIRNGIVVTADGQAESDIRVRDGEIVEIGENLAPATGAREIDASGMLVLPGGIDPHVHLSEDRADDYTSGSAAALAGGVTTVSNFISPRDGESLFGALQRAARRVRAEAIADVILHPIIGDPGPVPDEVSGLAAAGHTSLKVFMVRPEFDQSIPGFMTALRASGEAGLLMMVHCEDAAMVRLTGERLIAQGRGSLRFFPEARPVLAEVVATQRAVAMSEATGSPIYLVHLSSERALRVAEDAQARGLPVFVETRPIYLHLTEERFEGPDRGLFVGWPPLRTARDQDSLWDGIARGTIHVVATDHVANRRDQKLDPEQTVMYHRPGMNNLQVIRPMLYSEGVRTGRITLERFVEVTSTNPAKLFGLYPKKGVIAEGADADLVLWDPQDRRTIRDADILSRSGFSIYAGWEVTGWPHMTIRRGEVVYADGEVTGEAGSGQLVHRGRSQMPTAIPNP